MPPEKTDRLPDVLKRLLRPLARVMIARGVTITAAVELLKGAMVEVAEQNERDRGHLTDSRVSLLTGLHRKDVRRLRRGEAQPAKRSFEGACALVVAYWSTDDRFLNAKGKPRKLAAIPDKKSASFHDLVRAVGIDLPTATVLEELEKTKIVAVNLARTEVKLLKTAYLPDASSNARLEAFDKNLSAHLEAASSNLLADHDEAPFFERAAHFNNLSVESIRQLDMKARKLKQALLEQINRDALAYQKEDSKDSKNRQRISFGAYLHTTLPNNDLTKKSDKTPDKDRDE